MHRFLALLGVCVCVVATAGGPLASLLDVTAIPTLVAPNGTYLPATAHNFTLCPPGTFQPRAGQTGCLKCPVGFFCPQHGMSQPVLCPPGRVCDSLGTIQPNKECPRGHFCLAGTKSMKPDASMAIEVPLDRKRVVLGKSVSERVGTGGRRIIQKNKKYIILSRKRY